VRGGSNPPWGIQRVKATSLCLKIMCVIIAKWFPDLGFVGVKQRDRNYVPVINFEREEANGMTILMYRDEMTGYREGMNSKGISILSASLKVQDDEKEIEKKSTKHTGDGDRINKALREPTLNRAVKSCIDSKLTGNTVIFDKDNCYLLEACSRPCKEGAKEDAPYEYKLKKIGRDTLVARTNHGIDLPWAGYQMSGKSAEQESRKSSEARQKIAQSIASKANSPEEILALLRANYSRDPQMNPTRKVSGNKKMRTTAQILLIPSEEEMKFIPIDSRIKEGNKNEQSETVVHA
jgi:NAD-dependent dihydropyrimidine dehydrogenase PreA subunit